jgi:hypothetical protein
MTFEEFHKDMKLTEGEAHELIYLLAAIRMRKTLEMLNRIPPDKTAADQINEWREPQTTPPSKD